MWRYTVREPEAKRRRIPISDFFTKIDFHISFQSVRSIIYHIMARNHTILDSLVYLEICNLFPSQRDDSLVHSILEFMETKFDFPMKFGNLGTDLIKFSWTPKSFHPNNIPELRLHLSKIYTAVSGAFLCAAGKTLISPDEMTVSGTESLAKSLKCR